MVDENKKPENLDDLEDDTSLWEDSASDEESSDIVASDSDFEDEGFSDEEDDKSEDSDDEENEEDEEDDEVIDEDLSDDKEYSSDEEEKPKDNKKKMLIGAAALVVAIAAGGTIMTSGGGSGKLAQSSGGVQQASHNNVKHVASKEDAIYEQMIDKVEENKESDAIVNDLELAAKKIDQGADKQSKRGNADIGASAHEAMPDGALKRSIIQNADNIKELDERLTRLEGMLGNLSKTVDEINVNLKKLSNAENDSVNKKELEKVVREQVKAILAEKRKARISAKKAVSKKKTSIAKKSDRKVKADKPKNPHVIDDWKVLAWAPEEGTAVVMGVSGQVYLVKKGKRFEKGHFTPYKIGDGYVYTDKGVIVH